MIIILNCYYLLLLCYYFVINMPVYIDLCIYVYTMYITSTILCPYFDNFKWLMPLASQYLLLVLYNVQAYIKMLFRVTC